jgi:hypothetical protein
MTAAGPPERHGLFDALDVGLAALRGLRRQVVLHRFDTGSKLPLTFREIGRRTGRSGTRVSLVLRDALRELPVLAGPGFGSALRDLVRVVDQGADLGAELVRAGRNPSLRRERQPWDSPLFYERLIVALAPSLASTGRSARPPAVSDDDVRYRTRRPTSPGSKAKASLGDTIRDLTQSLVDSVMMAIRNAPLEELVGDGLLGPTVLKTPGMPERSRRSPRARASLEAKNRRPPTAARQPTHPRKAPASPSDGATHELTPEVEVAAKELTAETAALSSEEITDPMKLLGFDLPSENADQSSLDRRGGRESAELSSPRGADESIPRIRLRHDETVARVSSAGVVLRRQARAPNGVPSS